MSEFKISLAAARVNAGLTQEYVANKMEVTRQSIVNWEKGKVIPKPAQFKMMCDLYAIPQNYIFLDKT